jgi:TRAP-type C4-dicarboxylate transport system substrate-binding protein
MRIARRTFLASSIGLVCAPAILRIARAENPQVTLKLHHAFSSVSGVHDKFLAPWARKIEAESAGRIRIDVFPSMQLGGAPPALFEQVREGSADLVWTAPSLTSGRFPKIETFELPFLASRRALVSSKALSDFAAANLQDEFREIYPICFSCSDRAVIHANRPVRTMEDLKSLKLHVQTRFVAEAMRILGAQPVTMPNEQLPMAISEHVIDACLDPWHLVPPFRLNDVLRLHTEFADVSPNVRTYVLAMNRASYDRLPRELKSVIDNNSGHTAAAMAGAMWDAQATAIANMAVERGDLIVTLLPDAMARWRKAVEPVLDTWRKELKEHKIDGGKLINAAHGLLAKYANEPEPPISQTSPSQTSTPSQQVTRETPQSASTGATRPNGAPSDLSTRGSVGSPAAPAPQSSQPPARLATPTSRSPSAPTIAPSTSGAGAPPVKPVAPAAPASAPAATTPSSAQISAPMNAPAATAAPTVAPPTPPAPPVAPVPSVAAAPAAPAPVPKPLPKTLDIRL